MFGVFFFFKQKTAYEMRISDWSSDVCSSDLDESEIAFAPLQRQRDDRRRCVPTTGDALDVAHDHIGLVVATANHQPARAFRHETAQQQNAEAEQRADAEADTDRKSTRLNSSHSCATRMPSSA